MLSDTCPVSQSYAHVLCRSISCRTYFEMPNTSVAEHRDFGYVLQNTLRNFLGVQNRVRNFVEPLVNRFWTIFEHIRQIKQGVGHVSYTCVSTSALSTHKSNIAAK